MASRGLRISGIVLFLLLGNFSSLLAQENLPAIIKKVSPSVVLMFTSAQDESPVANLKGEVIGVATFQSVEGQNLNFALPGERIDKLKPSQAKTVAEWNAKPQNEKISESERLLEKGKSYLWAGDYEKAIPYFEKAAQKNPLSVEAYFYLGVNYAQLGRYQEAVGACSQAVRLKPNYAEAHYNLCVAYASLGRYQEAVEACSQAVRLKPNYAKAHFTNFIIGLAYAKLGRYQEAVGACKQAIRLKPDDAAAPCILGEAYNHLGRYNEAIESCKQAIRLMPDLADAHLNLGLSYLALGDKGSALEEYKILKNLDKEKANELFNLIYK